MIFNSIRWRVQIWHGLILVLVLVGFGATAYHVARDNQLRRIDRDLEQRLALAFSPEPQGHRSDRGMGGPDRGMGPDRGTGPDRGMGGPDRGMGPDRSGGPPGNPRFDPFEPNWWMRDSIQQIASVETVATNEFYYVLLRDDGSVVVQSPGAPADIPAPERPQPPAPNFWGGQGPGQYGRPSGPGSGSASMAAVTRTRGPFREMYQFLPWTGCLVVGHSMASDLAAMRRLALWLTAAGAGVLVFGLAGGWWLASRAIRPIEAISATATRIAAGDLSQRIKASDTDSELGRLAGLLNSTFARLEAAFGHQARFTSDASHELRTPVAVILSQTQTALSRERPAPEYRESLEACQRAAQRMRKLTESLLELARLDAGQESMKHQPFDLGRVARESLELIRPLAAERRLELQSELPAIQCLGDAERIAQVATNLLTNAIQFNRDGGRIRLAAGAENGTAFLSVTDTGPGIPAQDLAHIFERFYRVDKSRSRAQGHAGLGLAICKAIVDAHGGTLDVSSNPGTGSTFTLKLPAR